LIEPRLRCLLLGACNLAGTMRRVASLILIELNRSRLDRSVLLVERPELRLSSRRQLTGAGVEFGLRRGPPQFWELRPRAGEDLSGREPNVSRLLCHGVGELMVSRCLPLACNVLIDRSLRVRVGLWLPLLVLLATLLPICLLGSELAVFDDCGPQVLFGLQPRELSLSGENVGGVLNGPCVCLCEFLTALVALSELAFGRPCPLLRRSKGARKFNLLQERRINRPPFLFVFASALQALGSLA